MNLQRIAFATLLLAFIFTTSAVAESPKPAVSLRYSCFDKPFLSVDVSTLRRDSFPAVELQLVDPLKRPFGAGNRGERNSKSQYGKIFQIPEHKEKSSVVAVEICDAIPGDYVLTITEQSNDRYRLRLEADNESLSEWFRSRQGATCAYRFRVQTVDHHVNVRWLNDTGNMQSEFADPDCKLSK